MKEIIRGYLGTTLTKPLFFKKKNPISFVLLLWSISGMAHSELSF